MLVQGEYEKLDAIAAKLLKEETGTEEGVWQLTWFHRYLTSFWSGRTEEHRKTLISAAEKWIQQSPKSQTPAAVLAAIYINIGWDIRGSGFADKVTEEGWKGFRENLNKALEILKPAENRESKDPEFYRTLLIVGRGLDKPTDWIQNAFDRGIAAKSNYQDLYKEIAEYLLPRWHGSSREVRGFAEAAIQPALEGQSHIMYAYIATWAYIREYARTLCYTSWIIPASSSGVNNYWPWYPNSDNNANRLCIFACLYQDKETARKMFGKIENRIVADIWKNDGEFFGKCKTWAFLEDKTTQP